MTVVEAVFCGLLILFAAVAVTIAIYLGCRIKFAHTKFIVEASIILFALVLSIGTKASVLLDASGGPVSSAGSVFDALYKAIGGLTFEGVSPADEASVEPHAMMLYYGASLYAGLVTIFVVSVKASYEFYSKLRLCLPTLKSIYIITDISEETLLLAKDIKRNDRLSKIVFAGPRLAAFDRHNELCQQAMANGFLYWSYSRKARRHVGKTAEKGNGDNNGATAPDKKYKKEKLSEFIKGFFYFGEKSIAARVGGPFSFGGRGLFYLNKNNPLKRIVVLAFAAENHVPLEAENIKIVCDDVRTRIERPDYIQVEYILQTKDGIIYDAYDKMYAELYEEYKEDYISKYNIVYPAKTADNASKEEKDNYKKTINAINDEIKREFYGRVVINCWCESEAISKQAFEKMTENGLADFLAESCSPLYLWTLGFGARGKAITHELYVQSANIDDRGRPRKCLIDVFDAQADKVGGIYKFEHPNFIYVTDNDMEAKFSLIRGWLGPMINRMSYSSNEEKEEMEKACYKQIKAIGLPLAEYGSKRYSWQTDKRDFYNNDSETGIIPRAIFRFNQVSCNGERFFEMIDRETGVDRSRTRSTIKKIKTQLKETDFTPNDPCSDLYDLINTPSAPKVITVATGDDETNLEIANALIQDVINEDAKYKGQSTDYEKEKQYLIVNITDKSNNVRLRKGNGVWDAENKVLCINSRFYVIVVGNFNDIYTYDSVSQTKECYYNHIYEEIGSAIYKIDEDSKKEPDESVKNALIDGQNFILTAGIGPGADTSEKGKVVSCIAESSKEAFEQMAAIYAQMGNIRRLNLRQRFAVRSSGLVIKISNMLYGIAEKFRSRVGAPDCAVSVNSGYIENLAVLIKKTFRDRTGGEYIKILDTSFNFLQRCLSSYFRGRFYFDSQEQYLSKTIWDKRSNRSAVTFNSVLKALYIKGKANGVNGALYARLCAAEHDRWVRLHLAYGWVYTDDSSKEKKNSNKAARRHNCLKSYSKNFDASTVLYDLGNVIWAICNADKNSSEQEEKKE